jgi:hypothetical protein
VDKFTKLKEECELLKTRLRELESTPVNELQETIKQIQLAAIKAALTQAGQQLRNYAISKGIYDD